MYGKPLNEGSINLVFLHPLEVPIDSKWMERTKDMGRTAISMSEWRCEFFFRRKIPDVWP